MGKNIDDLSRNLARGMPRRRALAIFAGGVAATVLGRKGAEAASRPASFACQAFCLQNFRPHTQGYSACLADCSPCTTNVNFAGQPCPLGTTCITITPAFGVNYTTNYVINSTLSCPFSVCIPGGGR